MKCFCLVDKTYLSRVLVTGLRTQKILLFWQENTWKNEINMYFYVKHLCSYIMFCISYFFLLNTAKEVVQNVQILRNFNCERAKYSHSLSTCTFIEYTCMYRCVELGKYEWIIAFRRFLILTHSCFIVFFKIHYFKSTNEVLACEPENFLFSEVWKWRWRWKWRYVFIANTIATSRTFPTSGKITVWLCLKVPSSWDCSRCSGSNLFQQLSWECSVRMCEVDHGFPAMAFQLTSTFISSFILEL